MRYINYKLQNGTSDYLNVQLLDESDCFKILQVIRSAEWQKLIPVPFNESFAERIGSANRLFREILSLHDFIEHSVFLEIYNALEIELSFDVFVNRTFELIDFFRSCGDQYLRVVSGRCAVCYAHSDSLGFLLIGDQSWKLHQFPFSLQGQQIH